MATVRESK